MDVRIPVSLGELIDKITILEIKTERIEDPDKLRNIRFELDGLLAERARVEAEDARVGSARMAELRAQLKEVNARLWAIEDDIRDQERAKTFGETFIALARAVYVTNDRRAALKRAINDAVGSRIVEEKSYAAY